MADVSKCDREKYHVIKEFLQKTYPIGEDHFATLIPTLRYIADIMEEVLVEIEAEKNPTGVLH